MAKKKKKEEAVQEYYFSEYGVMATSLEEAKEKSKKDKE